MSRTGFVAVAHVLFVPTTRLARIKELAIFEWREHLVQMLLDDFSHKRHTGRGNKGHLRT